MITLSHEPPRRPYRIHHSRTYRVTGAVLLAHVTVTWLLTLDMLSQQPATGEADSIIMASVIIDTPTGPAPKPQSVQRKVKPQPPSKPTPVVQPKPQSVQHKVKPQPPSKPTPVVQPKPQPVQRKVKPQPPSKPTPVVQPSPVVAQAAPAEAAPIVPTPASAPAVGNQRPNTTPSLAVVLPSTDADYLNNPTPPYPRISRRMGEQGTVVIRVFINTEGRAERAEIRTSSGYTRLDDVALDTVKRWRFVPGKRAGVPEAMWFNVPLRFVLD
jgi:protein TonB